MILKERYTDTVGEGTACGNATQTRSLSNKSKYQMVKFYHMGTGAIYLYTAGLPTGLDLMASSYATVKHSQLDHMEHKMHSQ
jgi:hypothetical protein